MNNFEKLQSMSVDELAAWLNKYLIIDDYPHIRWFAKTYCDKCEAIVGQHDGPFGVHKCEFAYCEMNDNCRYFQELSEIPSDLEMIKLWLEAEVTDEEIQ